MEPTGLEPGRVYLDYAGFAPVDPRVLAVMRPFLEAGIGNPSARHSLGAEARESLDAARVKVARLCGGAPGGVIFTSGATEANNLAVRGVTARARAGSARILLSAIEHISIINAGRELEKAGATVVYLPVDGDGRVDLAALRAALGTETALVSIAAANPEIGTVQPLKDIGRLTRAAGVPLHVDGVGALGRVPLNVEAMSIDLLTMSGNDLYGPPGSGALWARPGLRLHPQMLGGGQEGGYRSGTENLPGVVGLGGAAQRVGGGGSPHEGARRRGQGAPLIKGLLEAIPDCRLTGSARERLPHHVSLLLQGVKADAVLLELDLAGVAASSGSACASLTQTPSHVLRAIGCADEEAEGSLCFTLGRWSTGAEVDVVLERLPPIVARLRALAPPLHT